MAIRNDYDERSGITYEEPRKTLAEIIAEAMGSGGGGTSTIDRGEEKPKADKVVTTQTRKNEAGRDTTYKVYERPDGTRYTLNTSTDEITEGSRIPEGAAPKPTATKSTGSTASKSGGTAATKKTTGPVTADQLEALKADFSVAGIATARTSNGQTATWKQHPDGSFAAPTFGKTATTSARMPAQTRPPLGDPAARPSGEYAPEKYSGRRQSQDAYNALYGNAQGNAMSWGANRMLNDKVLGTLGGLRTMGGNDTDPRWEAVQGTQGSMSNPQFQAFDVQKPGGGTQNVGHGFSTWGGVGGNAMTTSGALGQILPSDPIEAAAVEMAAQQRFGNEMQAAQAAGNRDPRNAAAWAERMRNDIYNTPAGLQYNTLNGGYVAAPGGRVTVGNQHKGYGGVGGTVSRGSESFSGFQGEPQEWVGRGSFVPNDDPFDDGMLYDDDGNPIILDQGTPQGGLRIRRPAILIDAATGQPLAELSADGADEMLHVTPTNPAKRQGGLFLDRNRNGLTEFDNGTPTEEVITTPPPPPTGMAPAETHGAYYMPTQPTYNPGPGNYVPVPGVAPVPGMGAAVPAPVAPVAATGNTPEEDALYQAQLADITARRGENERIQAGLRNTQNIMQVATAERDRRALGHRWDKAGVSPVDILNPLEGDTKQNLPPGLRYAHETMAQIESRRAQRDQTERGFGLDELGVKARAAGSSETARLAAALAGRNIGTQVDQARQIDARLMQGFKHTAESLAAMAAGDFAKALLYMDDMYGESDYDRSQNQSAAPRGDRAGRDATTRPTSQFPNF